MCFTSRNRIGIHTKNPAKGQLRDAADLTRRYKATKRKRHCGFVCEAAFEQPWWCSSAAWIPYWKLVFAFFLAPAINLAPPWNRFPILTSHFPSSRPFPLARCLEQSPPDWAFQLHSDCGSEPGTAVVAARCVV